MMSFQDLTDHLGSAVVVDHLLEDSYFARNCISGRTCIIENLPNYSAITLCHYFHTLGVSPPLHLRDAMIHYETMSNNLNGILNQQD